MKQLAYTDPDGRKYMVALPDDAPDSHARLGIVIGPPLSITDSLMGTLPKGVAIEIHNALFDRRIFTWEDARTRVVEVRAAIQAALGATLESVLDAYRGSQQA